MPRRPSGRARRVRPGREHAACNPRGLGRDVDRGGGPGSLGVCGHVARAGRFLRPRSAAALGLLRRDEDAAPGAALEPVGAAGHRRAGHLVASSPLHRPVERRSRSRRRSARRRRTTPSSAAISTSRRGATRRRASWLRAVAGAVGRVGARARRSRRICRSTMRRPPAIADRRGGEGSRPRRPRQRRRSGRRSSSWGARCSCSARLRPRSTPSGKRRSSCPMKLRRTRSSASPCWRRARASEAVSELARASELDPQSPARHGNLGTALMMSGRTKEAIVEYEARARMNDGDPRAHSDLGTALLGTQDLPRAVAELARAVQGDPTRATFQPNLGFALQQARAHRRCDRRIPRRAASRSEARERLDQPRDRARREPEDARRSARRAGDCSIARPGRPTGKGQSRGARRARSHRATGGTSTTGTGANPGEPWNEDRRRRPFK